MKTPSYFPFSNLLLGISTSQKQCVGAGVHWCSYQREASETAVGEDELHLEGLMRVSENTCFMRFTKKAPSKSQGRGPGSPGN